jgi:hypothetical protein
MRSYWQRVIPGIFLLEIEYLENNRIDIVSPTIPQYPPTIINIEPKSRAAFPLSVRKNYYLINSLLLIKIFSYLMLINMFVLV